ncbi:hypothetical protein N7539_007439 [Penicillium diatomitis]|uniref:Inositol-pentakisphosphate 2-kinase n=1 Tax=Penicillium diatomitis TaxID=2819901 RepID=A0A9W9WVH2_9EURO|nr:uncharacterized protein N7539_007439 [Penicillium diatomitis]KAJ5477295.1 hypothetical protein N7539_007439 [Penicillium diatomitis]
MARLGIPDLPSGIKLVYLAEGAANVVYRFDLTEAFIPGPTNRPDLPDTDDTTVHEAPGLLQGKLLRLRKDTPANVPYKEIEQNFDTIIRPLFKLHELVNQSLIRLPPGLIHHCNERLRAAEESGSRAFKRHGTYLSLTEPYGLLITDMTTYNDPGAHLAELKPKWLLQSPSAPADADRCRTCALKQMRDAEARSRGQEEQRSFCPLSLVSEKFEIVLRATEYVKGCWDKTRLAEILFRHPVLLRLLSLQKVHQRVGLEGPPPKTQVMSLDMTLRDCTVYIKIPQDEGSQVEVRLGDLDLKSSAGGKAQYWRDLETDLIEGGWYHGRDEDATNDHGCLLQHSKVPAALALLP